MAVTTRQRLERARRLLTVQEQMRGIAERDLAATRRDLARVEADRAAMLTTLAGETMHGLFLDAAARRLRSLAGEATQLDATAAQQAGAVRERSLSEKRVARQVETLALTRAREREQADVLEQLDLMALAAAAACREGGRLKPPASHGAYPSAPTIFLRLPAAPMSISPPTDIVLDVARAADPARYQEATAKLGAPGATDPAAFGDAYRMAGASVHMPLDARSTLTALQTDNVVSGAGKIGDPYKQFEAFVLRQFVETTMPSKAASVFGKGNAGGIWKSMLADQIGTQVAKAGGLGIAKMLEAARPLDKTTPAARPTGPSSGV